MISLPGVWGLLVLLVGGQISVLGNPTRVALRGEYDPHQEKRSSKPCWQTKELQTIHYFQPFGYFSCTHMHSHTHTHTLFRKTSSINKVELSSI